MKEYKILVVDIDGTLTLSDGTISKRVNIALRKIQQMGITLVLASGRPTYGIKPLAESLDMATYGGYVISYNGGQILKCTPQGYDLIFEKKIDSSFIATIEEQAVEHQLDMMTYHTDFIVTNSMDNPYIQKEAQINGMRLVYAPMGFTQAVFFNPCKCVLVSGDGERLQGFENQWQKRMKGALDVLKSESYFLEIVPPAIDKANTLAVLLEHLGVSSKEIVAIGDGERDFAMIQMAELGIAMGNATEALKACADEVTLSNDQDGVAVAVEKVFLSAIHPSRISLEQLNAFSESALMGNLGIQYTYADDTRIEATMPVDERTRQPFGVLHGGATLALAETLAGVGSLLLCQPDEIAFGMQVSGNHVSSAHQGDTVRAVATILHKGRSTHVWNIDVFTSTDKLVSSVRVINSVMKK